MSTSASLDEKFKVVMKSYQKLSAQNEMLTRNINEDAQRDQELKAQNEYLKKQLSAFLK